ncbi:hypothetical protein ABEB36_005126 [Hypothenemus hampei]|uniref:Choline transporter-like protein n=1 Tax=Hypothenemus hampei TaxID=57062 RepID=A0ABD1F039_HYPHA
MSRSHNLNIENERQNFNSRRPYEFDANFHGPLRRRSCTDVICLLLFLIFIGCWAAIGIWAILNGDPNNLLIPSDSHGFRCGVDETVKDRKYLFFFDLTECLSPQTPFVGCSTKQICVEKCPEVVYIPGLNSSSSAVDPYCDYLNTSSCPQWLLPSTSFQKRCIPSLSNLNSDDIKEAFESYTSNTWSQLQTAIENIKLISDIEKYAQQIIADVVTSWWKIVIGIGFALVACIIYILMLRWIAGVMVWISIAGVVAALAAATYFSYDAWQTWKNQYIEDSLTRSKTNRDIFLAIFIIVVIVLVIVLLILLVLRKRIALAIALIKEGSKAVSSVTSVLFFPIFPWILQIGVVAYAICVGVYLATTGEPLYYYKYISDECSKQTGWINNTQCFPSNFSTSGYSDCLDATCRFVGMANEAYYPYLQAFNVFGFFWLAFFVSALGQMTLAQVFAQWYWTMRKRNLPFFAVTSAFYRTIRYHLGTLAFGSLIIAICRMIRVCLEYIDHKLKKYDNELTKAILCCLKCFFWCLEKFLKFINKNAYIMCAIHGKNFCASAKDAFTLLLRNIIRVFVLDKVTDFLFFLSKVLIAVGVGAVAYLFFATNLVSFMDNSELNFGLVPVIAIMLVTYLISTLFFNVYSMAVDTLFLCFLEDIERNDGKSRPYFMSTNLMKIFGKKNKGPKHD